MHKDNGMRLRAAFLVGTLLVSSAVAAQSFRFTAFSEVLVTRSGSVLPDSWAGGLNAGQFGRLDLNGDGVLDLVTFDRTTSRLHTFLAVAVSGTFRYRSAPDYENYFPSLRNWVLFRDYDGDNRPDLFTSTPFGIKVFRNVTAAGTPPAWEVASHLIFTIGLSGSPINLQVPVTDIPAIVDVDSDGDLDVLTFDGTGSFIEYNKNESLETFGDRRSVAHFRKVHACWGRFAALHHACGEFVFGQVCQSTEGRMASEGNREINHSGASLLAFDADGDNDLDLLLGDVSCNNLRFLPNSGSSSAALMETATLLYPTGTAATFPIFPAAFYEDVDFDGKPDLLASPNLFANEANSVDFAASAWYWQNVGTASAPIFEFRQPDFLQSEQLDLGEDAAPALADLDGDGDLDLLVGYRGQRWPAGEYYASLWHFENTGTPSAPAFHLRSPDWLGLSAWRLSHLRPQFADLNRDGSLDLAVAGRSGSATKIYWLPNEAARGQPFRSRLSNRSEISFSGLQNGDTPAFADVDGDGDSDVLLGRTAGNLAFFRNNGNLDFSPVTELVNDIAGGVYQRNLTPAWFDLNGDRRPELITGRSDGQLAVYADIRAGVATNQIIPADTAIFYNSLAETQLSGNLGGVLYPTAGDLNGDGLAELIVGTQGGGLRLWQNNSERQTPSGESAKALLYPNPTSRYVYLDLQSEAEINLYSVLGMRLLEGVRLAAGTGRFLDLEGLPAGMYLLRISQAGSVQVEKLVVRPLE